ncbi:RNA polymerase I second largest subunit [Trypanosoma equiperdum]|uniref:DNA-directed RNA polymerase subunit beta n=1 Tax=Trypanosoma equiperdum TaxID=5694 RepID=A0A1G4HZX6_TRYEQ|nr:RNA polymerase I second largest subunit [Trypanosoma equiperdum]
MSTKNSVVGSASGSHASTAGETVTSTRSGTSSRHSRQRRQQYDYVKNPSEPMTAMERLKLVRCSIARLRYLGERHRHTSKLDTTGGDRLLSFFEGLRKRVLKLEYNPRVVAKSKVGAPKHLDYIRGHANALLGEASTIISECEQAMDRSEAVYEGLAYHQLQDTHRELENLVGLLSGAPSDMESAGSLKLLADLVSPHVAEFDAFAEQRVPEFLQELKNEGFLFSSVINDSQQPANAIGLLSVFIVDVAIGVRPGRSARLVIQHALHNLARLKSRVDKADLTLGAEEDSSNNEHHRMQSLEFEVIRGRLREAKEELERIRDKWDHDEGDIFSRAGTGVQGLQSIIDAKRVKESTVIEEAQAIHDRTVYACLPFASPQYCRIRSETYSQPCHVRVGFKFVAKGDGSVSRTKTQLIYNLMPEFLILMRQQGIAPSDQERFATLAPSKYELWLSLGELPEMVLGARCALRGVNQRLDHFRALEEQKEVGGYFVLRGGERILRNLILQRCNVPLNIERERFATVDSFFSPRAVIIRCKRPSGLTVQNYFYYATKGEVIFTFARRVVWNIPALLVLSALNTRHRTSLDIYKLLTIGLTNGRSPHAARVEALLQHHSQMPYSTLDNFLDYLAVVGLMYRRYHESSFIFRFLPQYHTSFATQHDAWYGLFMLRRHMLPHLNTAEATPDLPPTATSREIREWLSTGLQEELAAKFDALIGILRQLLVFNDGATGNQGNDVLAYQEVFTVSQVLIGAFEVSLMKTMGAVTFRMAGQLSPEIFQATMCLAETPVREAANTLEKLNQLLEYSCRNNGPDPLITLNRLLLTGNFALDREEDFYSPQTAGWAVMTEHLNFYRSFEQLMCVHRGKSIAEMRSSDVRRYPCEAYGFICMVHSPDGEDCGVLNHLSISTVLSASPRVGSSQYKILLAFIEEELKNVRNTTSLISCVDQLVGTVPVWLEGRLLGYLSPNEALSASKALTQKKALRSRGVVGVTGIVRRDSISSLNTMEVVYIPPGSKDPMGLYIFYQYGRLMRPVLQIESPSRGGDLPFPVVYLGTWEQSWRDIAAVPSDLFDGFDQLRRKYEFMEQNGFNILSFTSSTIPFFEHNCSPRNLFQCGLSKQTAGTQLQTQAWRRDAKLFRMYYPQRYISRTLPMDYFGLDDVSLGVNAVVAILAYTGYDLDDAMILNSTAKQFGMLNAGVTVAKIVKASGKGDSNDVFVFHNCLPDGQPFTPELDRHGLPKKRAVPNATAYFSFDTDHKYPSLRDSSAVYCCAKRFEYIDPLTNEKTYEYTRHQITKWRHFDKGEDAWVHSVIPLTYDGPDPTSVLVLFRIPRPPVIGDKFSSRHGQKGTLPLDIRSHDLPFSTRDGITPDIIINPHAFPSRMTVGMVLEMMGAKLGCIQGRLCDHSAWSVIDEQPRSAKTIGDALEALGYNRYGREKLIDGITGEEIEAEVLVGISGYQRLRHMVSDKWQARARTDSHTHRAVTKTGQPVKGRKRHGGVRVGEMERDALLSHGVAEVVIDRLLHVSDKTKAFICVECGSMLSIYERHATEYSTWKTCKFCSAGLHETDDTIAFVEIPQVLRLWATELTSVGIRVVLKTSETSL